MVEIGCRLLEQGPLKAEEFRHFVSPAQEEETAAELIPFLLDSGLVERFRGRIRLAPSYNPAWRPQLNLLALLHGRTDTNYAFRFIWEAVLDRPDWANRIVNRDDVWPIVNQVPIPGASLPQLNANRMASWMRIASWLGLIQPERSNSFMLLPTTELVRSLLALTVPYETETSVFGWVSAVEAQFCRVSSVPGSLHPGFASVLGVLALKSEVQLTTYSDEQLYQVGPVRASHLTVRKGKAA
jgi:hypothetical protein